MNLPGTRNPLEPDTGFTFDQRLNLRRALLALDYLYEDALQLPSAENAGLVESKQSSSAASFEWNSVRDTRFAVADSRFDHVAHLFHLEWFGMRAAAGALPGRKLGITASKQLTTVDLVRIAELLSSSGVRAIVVHGFSSAMSKLVQTLRKAGFDNINLVWHGAPAMWISSEERKLFFSAQRLLHAGVLRRMHGMRRGTELLIGKGAWVPQLLNVPPAFVRTRGDCRDDLVSVFAPSWNLLHKNLATNVAAAAMSPKVDRVYVLTRDIELPPAMAAKLTSLPKLDQLQMMQMMEQCEVVMNASLVDCHPMVEMEAIASGTPAIRGPLDLDTLEDHPYVALTEVQSVLNASAVARAIERVLNVPRPEMMEIMSDYAGRLRETALERYLEFCEVAS